MDWNEETIEDSEEEEDMSVEDGLSIKETNMSISSSSKSESDENEKDDSDLLLLGSLKKSIFCLIYKIENRFGQEKLQFRKAISAFIKQCNLLSESHDARIQKALFTFAKDNVWKKGKKKNAGQIPVQNSAKSRRRIKHRGSGPSQSGRPTNEQSLRIQLQVEEEEDIVSHSQPSRKKSKPKHPHSIAAAVAANRAAEKKH